jgi:hypothetical protein
LPTIRSSRFASVPLFGLGAVVLSIALSLVLAQAPTASPPQTLPPVSEVLKAYIEAVGGQSTLDAVKSWEMTGRLLNARRVDPDKTKAQIFWKAPDKSRIVLKSLTSVENQGFDGQKPWVLMQHGHGHKLSNDKLDILQIVCNPLRFTRMLTIYPGVTTESKVTLDGHTFTILLANVSWGDRRFSFDDESHFLVQIEDHFKSGDPPRFTRFREYKSVESLRIPHVIEQNWMDQLEGGGIRIEKVKLNAPIRDMSFESPR